MLTFPLKTRHVSLFPFLKFSLLNKVILLKSLAETDFSGKGGADLNLLFTGLSQSCNDDDHIPNLSLTTVFSGSIF